ncbi:Proteasome-interacting protein CIC1 [Cyberlindnera fabianii]|uniref:Proteasome-interacting protein CIC1 n=1 Tax=Cyberlindnera fabianii TaxID=36022 RepID=A0A1V2KZ65_CYBFA|nr:Proteasome-interacting protein CIC1 [Cyberlindnera fabianii]
MVKKVTKKTVSKSAKVQKPKGKVVKSAGIEDMDVSKIKVNEEEKHQSTNLVEINKIQKALSELKKFITKKQEEQESDLFTTKKTFKPKMIKIENRPKTEETPSVALLVRDNIIDKDLLEQIESSELNEIIGEIIPGVELKTTYKQFEKRRQLYSKYDIFLADDALVTSLPKLMGKTFYDSKKIPVPIKIGDKFNIKTVTNQVKKAQNSVIYTLPRSNNLVISLGDVESVNENVIEQVIKHFENEEIKGIFLKSNDSPALPLYEKEDAYTAEDVAEPVKTVAAASTTTTTAIEGLPENIKLSSFEKGLMELVQDEDVPQLLASKIKKSQQKAKAIAKKEKKDEKKKNVKVDAKNKVTKKTVKAKK